MPSCSQEFATSHTWRAADRASSDRSSNSVPWCIVQVIPHHQIVHAPSVGINELSLGRMRDQLIDQGAAFRSGMPKMRPAWEAR